MRTKEQFDYLTKRYEIMEKKQHESHISRIEKEIDNLSELISKLMYSLTNLRDQDNEEREMRKAQLKAMIEYFVILSERLYFFSNKQ